MYRFKGISARTATCHYSIRFSLKDTQKYIRVLLVLIVSLTVSELNLKTPFWVQLGKVLKFDILVEQAFVTLILCV